MAALLPVIAFPDQLDFLSGRDRCPSLPSSLFLPISPSFLVWRGKSALISLKHEFSTTKGECSAASSSQTSAFFIFLLMPLKHLVPAQAFINKGIGRSADSCSARSGRQCFSLFLFCCFLSLLLQRRIFTAEGSERAVLTLRIFSLAEITAEKNKQMMSMRPF